jgi:regulator of sirC expression with transglutaminase-like and TPR domain
MAPLPPFAELAGAPDGPLDVIALALAAEFRQVDATTAMQTLDALGMQVSNAILSSVTGESPMTPDAETELRICAEVLHGRHGFTGNRERYDDPGNSMLDVVLEARRGLPILLSVVYVEVARRAGVGLAGVGLSGHFVVGHFGADPPLLADPFAGGALLGIEPEPALVRPWRSREIAMRMLNNLVGSYQRRGDVGAAIRAAQMRLELPAPPALRDVLRVELGALQARLN